MAKELGSPVKVAGVSSNKVPNVTKKKQSPLNYIKNNYMLYVFLAPAVGNV
ncbi:hypothetical protein ACFFHM_18780 [Halalkalibacter kiskunsagensis]|uniref:Uncharacterized protein n=1 Tax=Halalkalibacter kiskunsagensis TaxID=1548599 RepID=A0ABV6KHN5_9BACI